MVNRRDMLKISLAGAGVSLLAPQSKATEGLHQPRRFNHRQHDLEWLKGALQTAIQVEFATIPLYLCAAWSIIDTSHPARNTILSIVKDEMLHMSLACNMLNAIGGTPDIGSLNTVPVYPTLLPGGLHPGLTLSLRRLTPSTLDAFMAIENPKTPLITDTAFSESSFTIGELYAKILDSFKQLQPKFIATNQIEGSLGVFTIRSVADVELAINEIIQQGAGTSSSPNNDTGKELAHYYRFAELHHGCRLAQNQSGVWGFHGDIVTFPSVYPMADIPPGGYQQQNTPGAVWKLLQSFDQTYSSMLEHLQSALTTGNEQRLSESKSRMRELTDIGVTLMQQPLSKDNSDYGNYGPCFRFMG